MNIEEILNELEVPELEQLQMEIDAGLLDIYFFRLSRSGDHTPYSRCGVQSRV